MKVALSVQVGLTREAYWDNVLAVSKENKYPLAPPDLVRGGMMDTKSYCRQNALLEEKSVTVMSRELSCIAGEPGFGDGPRGIQILGAGLLRDLAWLANAEELQFWIKILDCSRVACSRARMFVKKHSLHATTVSRVEVTHGWEISDCSSLIVYAGQFIQNLDDTEKDHVMEEFGRFLAGDRRRRVYLLHPRGEDNPSEEVEWRNTVPYTDLELLTPVEKGFGGRVAMDIIGTHEYFHQRYSFIRFAPHPNADVA